MRGVVLCILTFITAFSAAQEFSYPSIKRKSQQINDFIPAGWVILDSANGNLNKDNLQDVAMIVQHEDSIRLVNDIEDTVLTQPRMLIILFKTKADDSFILIEQSNSFIIKHDKPVMDDPFGEIDIYAGVLEIKFRLFYNLGSWYSSTASYKFRYQKEEFVLIGAESFSFHRATRDFEVYSYNFLTGKRSLTKGNDEKGTKKTTWKSLPISPLKTLKTFTEPFTWEVEPSVYL